MHPAVGASASCAGCMMFHRAGHCSGSPSIRLCILNRGMPHCSSLKSRMLDWNVSEDRCQPKFFLLSTVPKSPLSQRLLMQPSTYRSKVVLSATRNCHALGFLDVGQTLKTHLSQFWVPRHALCITLCNSLDGGASGCFLRAPFSMSWPFLLCAEVAPPKFFLCKSHNGGPLTLVFWVGQLTKRGRNPVLHRCCTRLGAIF